MSDENTISNIKINGTTYTINDPSKAGIEDIKIINEITQTNNELLNNAHSKLNDLLNRIENKNLTFFKCVSVKDTSTITTGDSSSTDSEVNSYIVSGCGLLYFDGEYTYAGEYNGKPYYTRIYKPSAASELSYTYYLSYRSDTSGWCITDQLEGSVTPYYYQSTISETPDGGVYAVVSGKGSSPAPTIAKGENSGDDSGNAKDLFVTFATAGSPYEGVFKHQGLYDNYDYWKHESAECYIFAFVPAGSTTVAQWTISQYLDYSQEPFYVGVGDTPISVSTWQSVKGTAYGLPTVTEYTSGSTSYAFSISGITTPAAANGNYVEVSPGIYKHETNEYYVSRDGIANYWCLSPLKNPSSPAYANFFATDSSITNPWDAASWSTNPTNTPEYSGTGTLVITKGGSNDTPSEDEIISYVVSGAGSPEYDGTYTYLDEYNGYPRYSCLGGDGSTMMYIQYNTALAKYTISAMGNIAYQISGTDITGTWSTNMGNAPAPTVTEVSAGGDNNSTSTIAGYSVIGAGTTAANGVYTLIDNTENNETWSNGTYKLLKIYANVLGEATTYYIYPISAGFQPSATNHTYYGYKSGGNYKANEVTWSVGTGSMAGIGPIPTFTPVYDESGGDSNEGDSGSDSNGTHGTWSGFKAILKYDSNNKKYYDFESVLTENLSYGDGFIPEVGRIYDENALIKIELYS